MGTQLESFKFRKNVIVSQNHYYCPVSASRNSQFWDDAWHSLLKHQKCPDALFAIDDPMYQIINDPSITLKHPLIDVDMESIVQKVFNGHGEARQNSRKPMVAVVTGMGRGKTRLLVDIDRTIRNKYPDTISIAITFNGQTSLIRQQPFSTMDINYVLAITSRMISSYYRISYDVSTNLVKNFLVAENGEEFDGGDHKNMFRSLIRHIVVEQRQIRSINRFVLLVDEVC